MSIISFEQVQKSKIVINSWSTWQYQQSYKVYTIVEVIKYKYTRTFPIIITTKNKKNSILRPHPHSPPSPKQKSIEVFSYLVFLVSLQKRLSASNILGHFIGRDDGLDVTDPWHKVTEVCQESVQVVRVVQTWLAVRSLLQSTKNMQLNLTETKQQWSKPENEPPQCYCSCQRKHLSRIPVL